LVYKFTKVISHVIFPHLDLTHPVSYDCFRRLYDAFEIRLRKGGGIALIWKGEYFPLNRCCHEAFTFSIYPQTCVREENGKNNFHVNLSFQPRLADCGSRRSAIHCADADIEYYRLRSFSITSHGICNLGDSMRWDRLHPFPSLNLISFVDFFIFSEAGGHVQ
jgi:hypothetical protein